MQVPDATYNAEVRHDCGTGEKAVATFTSSCSGQAASGLSRSPIAQTPPELREQREPRAAGQIQLEQDSGGPQSCWVRPAPGCRDLSPSCRPRPASLPRRRARLRRVSPRAAGPASSPSGPRPLRPAPQGRARSPPGLACGARRAACGFPPRPRRGSGSLPPCGVCPPGQVTSPGRDSAATLAVPQEHGMLR